MPDIDWIREFCLSFPATTEKIQWGENLCFKVRGKLFAVVDLAQGHDAPITLKSTAEKCAELFENDGIVPARYLGRYHWVRLTRASVLQKSELEDLIERSYEMVVAKGPKKKAVRKKAARRRTATRRPK